MVSTRAEVQPIFEADKPRPRLPVSLVQARFLVLPVAAVVLWITAAPGIHARAMNDLGLISVLPWQTWLAFGLLTSGFIACWQRADRAGWLLLVHVVLLIVMLYGLPALIFHEPSGPIVFRHAGITENLIRTRVVNTKIDAYFSWPGFFMGLASLVKIAGTPSALSFATWATVAFNLLYLPPLLLLTRALTRDPRLMWGTVWLFYIANWIKQDYLAPQSFGYLLYLTLLGLLLTYLRPRAPDAEGGGVLARRLRALLRIRHAEFPGPTVSRWTVAGIVALIVLLYTAIVASHQLTPIAILIGAAALVAMGMCTAQGLPLLMAVIVALWDVFVAHGYISGHFGQLLSSFGDISRATSANVTARISGSQDHLIVIRGRLLFSGGLWLLALAGGIRRLRGGHADHAAAALCVAPLLLFPSQVYGGEMLMRIYFFMLPFVAFFAAAAFVPGRRSGTLASFRVPGTARARAITMAFALTVTVVLASCLVARYGNERADYFTPAERAAISYLYGQARPGSMFAVEEPYLPWKYRGYDQHRYLSVQAMLGQRHPPSPAQAVAQISRGLQAAEGRPAGFVLLTRSQKVFAEMFGGALSPSYINQFEHLLRESPKFRLVYANSDAQVYARMPG